MEGLDSPILAPERLDRPFSDPLVQELFPPLATGVHWGLERTERALEALGDPHRRYRSLHIGGTNGKGSVTTTLAAALRAGGCRAASYTSPHLCSFRERIRVDGRALSEEALLRYAEDVRDPVLRYGLTFFEAVTVLAMHAFAREGVEVGVFEVGLGGRLDATNVLRPDVSAVTNVAMDHSDYLGDTLEDIGREKAGIMKPGVPFVSAESSPGIRALFRAKADEVGAPISFLESDSLQVDRVTKDGTAFRVRTVGWGELELSTPLVGRHQATNAALAVEVLDQLPEELRPGPEAVAQGILAVDHRGRDEVRQIGDTTWLFDVAHNTAGIQSLVDTIDRLELPRPLVAVVAVLGDKDWREMLPPLLSRTDAAYLTQAPSAPEDRRWDPSIAADLVDGLTRVRVVEDFRTALDRGVTRAGQGTVVVTGSVHTVGGAMTLLGIQPLA